jgi:hypothetical protein
VTAPDLMTKRGLAAPAAIACAILGLAGCGAATAVTTAPPTIAPATPTALPTPAPTLDLTASAAAAYLAAANKGNAAYTALGKTACGATTYTVSLGKSCWPKWAAIEQTFLTVIFGINYPASMKSDVDGQISTETKLIGDESTLAANPADATAHAAYQADSTAQTAAANIVRHDLGLPQVGA